MADAPNMPPAAAALAGDAPPTPAPEGVPPTAGEQLGEPDPAPKTPEASEMQKGMWYEAIADPELRGLAESRHWDNPEKALKSYRDLEKLRGVPPDKLARIPEDLANEEAMAEIYAKLGRPESPDGYASVDGADNGWLRELMHKAGVNDRQAKHLFEGYNAFMEQSEESRLRDFSQSAQVELDDLQREWGSASETNMRAAKRFAQESGLTVEEMVDIEQAIGTKKMMTTFAKWGRGVGEAQAPDGGTNSANGSEALGRMSREAAEAEWRTLRADPQWQAAATSADKKVREAALAKVQRLSKMAFD